jgi:hypothetical protein
MHVHLRYLAGGKTTQGADAFGRKARPRGTTWALEEGPRRREEKETILEV